MPGAVELLFRMSHRPSRPARLNIVLADADSRVVEKILLALREDGHAVFHAYDALSAIQLATNFPNIDLLITNTLVIDSPGIELVHQVRRRIPALPIMYIASAARSTPAIEAALPPDVPIVREPYDPGRNQAAGQGAHRQKKVTA